MPKPDAELVAIYNDVANARPVDALNLISILQRHDRRVSQECEAAAVGYFMLILPIMYYRKDLAEHLAPFPLQPLYYLGTTTGRQVTSWAVGELPSSAVAFRAVPEHVDDVCRLLPSLEKIMDTIFTRIATEDEED